MRAAAVHRDVPGGCIGCHGATAGVGVDHSFRADTRNCKPCHADAVNLQPSAAQRSLQDRARALAQRLEHACDVTPHERWEPAHAVLGRVACRAPGLARSMYELDLVLEDPAAFVHNAALARSLLDDAERIASQAAGVRHGPKH